MSTAAGRASAIDNFPTSTINFLHRIWHNEREGWGCVAAKSHSGKFEHHFVASPSHLYFWLLEHRDCDLYFCAARLSKKERKKKYASPSRWLFLDLDNNDGSMLHYPSLVIKTSKGSYQWLWQLDKHESAEDVEAWNRRLVRDSGADACWDAVHLLRLPYTRNYKYKPCHRVDLVDDDTSVYGQSWRPKKLPISTKSPVDTEEVSCSLDRPPSVSIDKALAKFGDKLLSNGRFVRNVIKSRVRVGNVDRDAQFFPLVQLRALGASFREFEAIVRASDAFQSKVAERGNRWGERDIVRLWNKGA